MVKVYGSLDHPARKRLIEQANNDHSQYPQYKNHWDSWLVVKAVNSVKTKLGVALVEGDYVLVQPGSNEISGNKEFVTVYSWRNRCNTSVPARSVVIV